MVFLVRSFEVGDLVVAFEVPDAGGDFVDQVMIVADQKDRSLIALQRNIQRIDGFKIEVVRGFVEDEDVWLLQHELAEEQTGGFASGKHAGGFGGFVALEEHLAEQAADFFADRRGIPLMQPVEHGHAAFDQAAMVLREISDGGFVSPDDFSGVDERAVVAAGLAQFGFGRGGRVREQSVDQRGLAGSVAAHEGDAFAASNAGGEVADDVVIAVGFAEVFDFENVFAGRPLLLELDIGALRYSTWPVR